VKEHIDKILRFVFAICMIGSVGLCLAGEPIWDGNKVEMFREQLAPGVYAFYPRDAEALNTSGGAAATSAGLIVGSKGALMIETMLNKRLFDQIQALTRDVTNAPALYAVNTSFHGDHSYGNMYLSPQTKIIQHQSTKVYVDEHLADDKAFMIQNFSAGRGIEEIKARTGDILVKAGDTLSIDLGGKQVQIIDFGYAQTGGDLFVWEPASKVMWTGNPIIAKKPALPWLLGGHLVETLETLRKVYAFLPDDARIVPGHGIPIGREDLRWHIDYLSAVKQNVQSAIDKGLTLEQTVARVTMPEFAGYVLFGWVHPSLNVPAAYKDLSAARSATSGRAQ
jgi:cyclase